MTGNKYFLWHNRYIYKLKGLLMKKSTKPKKSNSIVNKLYDAIVTTALKLEELLKQYEKTRTKKASTKKPVKKKSSKPKTVKAR